MNSLLNWLTSPEWAHVVKALLHSLWQGALIAAVAAGGMRRFNNPAVRYRVAMVALGALLLTGFVTWGMLNAPKPRVTAHLPAPESAPISSITFSGPMEKIVVTAQRTSASPKMQWTAWLALAWLLGASVMLCRASAKVAGAEQLRRGCQPLDDARITELLTEARRAVKLTRRVRVAVTNQLTSPAVVGVIVPTLILPLSLLTTLSPEQLRFVLLHELAHIRRGDYLANLFQLFAEALFFFNPAVWWLSHQIRREREACCDALAIELSGAPVDYARTLVSVAETMLTPSASAAPAFGNNRESSALADRVQRVLVPGYRPSLRLTWRAMLAALAVGVGLLGLLAAGTRETVAATTALVGSESASRDVATQTNSASGVKPARASSQPRLTGRAELVSELKNTRMGEVGFDHLPLQMVVQRLAQESRLRNPDRGINFIIQDEPVRPVGSASSGVGLAGMPITIEPVMRDVSLAEVLDAVVKTSPNAITYSVEDYGIVIKPAETNVPSLLTRVFKVPTNVLARVADVPGTSAPADVLKKLKDGFRRDGVDLEASGKSLYYNAGRESVYIRATKQDLDKVELVLGKASTPRPQVHISAKFVEVSKDANTDFVLGFLETMPSQSWDGKASPQNARPTSLSATNITPFTGILTKPQYEVVLRALEAAWGVEILTTPQVTTLSERQAQVRIVDTHTLAGAPAHAADEFQFLTGPILDVVPYVAADGESIQVSVIPTITELVGYDDPANFVPKTGSYRQPVSKIAIPHFHVRQLSVRGTLGDGQTLVIGGFTTEHQTAVPNIGAGASDLTFITGDFLREAKEPKRKQLLVFVTVTLVDAAGNQINPEAGEKLLPGMSPGTPIFPDLPENRIYDRYDGPKTLPGDRAVHQYK